MCRSNDLILYLIIVKGFNNALSFVQCPSVNFTLGNCCMPAILNPILVIRACIFSIGQIIATIILSIGGICLSPCSFKVRYKFITSWSLFNVWWATVICGIKYEIIGKENIPNQPCIVLSNHQSAWETFFLQKLLGPQTWVLKKQLLFIPFFGWALKRLEPIAIDRTKKHSVKYLCEQAKHRISLGRWVIIFPQGSRIPVGAPSKFSRSGALVAKEAHQNILPIAHNAGLFWPKSSFIKYPGTIKVVIGEPISSSNLSVDELHNKATNWLKENSEKLV